MDYKKDKKEFVKTVFDGGHFGEDLYEVNVEDLLKDKNVQKFLETPRSTEELTGRFAQLLSKLDFRAYFQLLYKALSKDDSIAQIMLQKGKSTSRSDGKRLRYLTLALMFATPRGKDIGEIYTQRALFLYEKSDYCSCLKDVDNAISHNICKKLKKMMTKVRRSAEEIVREQMAAEKDTRSAQDKKRRKDFCDNILFRPRGDLSKNIPVASSCVKVRFNKERGRYLITTEDLPPGSTVIVEDPYISQLQGMFKWDTRRCTFCYKISNCHVPCPSCVFALYCNEECMAADFKSHKYECKCAPALHGLSFSGMIPLSFRTICKAGSKDLYNLFKSKVRKPIRVAMNRRGFSLDSGKYESDSYYPMTMLANHQYNEDIPPLACAAVILVQVLQAYTEYFSIAPLERQYLLIHFVANQLVYHCTSFVVNSFEICDTASQLGINPPTSSLSKTSKKKGRSAVDDSLVTAVYPFISLLCHSCAPNCSCGHTTGAKMAVVTSQFVKEGDELTISYGHWFWSEGRNARRRELQQRYHFLCDCVACTGKWKKDGPLDKKMEYFCPNCSLRYSPLELGSGRRCVLMYDSSRKPARCTNCKTVTKLSHFEAEMEATTVMYTTAVRLIDEGTPMEAIPILAHCIKSFQYCVAPWRCATLYEMSAMLEKAHFTITNSLE